MDLIKTISRFVIVMTVILIGGTFLFAGDSIRAAAPYVVWTMAGTFVLAILVATAMGLEVARLFVRNYRARKNTDHTLIVNEAEQSDLDLKRDWLHYDFEQRALGAQAVQMDTGLVFATSLGEAGFGSHAAAVAKLIQNNNATAYLESPTLARWPEMIKLFDLLPGKQGDINNLVLGVSLDEETGRQKTISLPLESMVHEASGGETGTGKSALAYALAYQMATAPQDVKLILADPAGTTWKTMSQCERLMYPIVSSDNDLLHVLGELHDETERRTNELFAPYPTVEKLSEYNALAGPDEQLGYIVAMVDEFPEYLMNKDIEILLKRLIRKSRKAGIYIFAMGTSWKATDLDTSIKRQFRTKIHFSASDAQSSNVLLGSKVAAEIKEPGRAYARLPFGTSADLVEIQCAYLDKKEAMEHLSPQSILELPVGQGGPNLAEKATLEAHNRGKSWSACYRIYHKMTRDSEPPQRPSAAQIQIVKEICAKWGAK